jgi:hypothetical protein
MLSAESKSELLSIIDKLAELDKRKNEIREQEYDSRDRISVIRATNLVRVALSKDNKDKPLYPSEQVREAALTMALDKDTEYRTLREKLRMLENKLQEIMIDYTRLSNRKALLMFEAGLVLPTASEARAPIE